MQYLFKRRPRPIALAVATAMALSCAGQYAMAQDDDEDEGQNNAGPVDEIIIQAQRRDTTESTTAISMEVLTADDLAENQIVGFEDLQDQVPNLQFNTNGFGWAQANIRGVGNASGGGPAEQVGVPIIVDGGAQGEEISLGGAMMDVGNVQVLRGPQGTFIGQSAAGGAILVTSARPNFEGVNGFVEAQMGTYDQEKVTGAVNLPISDTLSARISFLSLSQGSFYTNIAGGRAGNSVEYSPGSSDERQFRVSLLWEPNENFSVYLKMENSELNYQGNPSTPSNRARVIFRDTDGDPATDPVPVNTYSGFFNPDPNGQQLSPNEPFVIEHPYPVYASQENEIYTLELAYEMDSGITLNSVSNVIEFFGTNGIASNNQTFGSFGPNFAFLYGPGNYTYNQEFTVMSPNEQDFQWLAGVSGSKRYTKFDFGYDPSQSLLFGPPFGPGPCGWDQQSLSWVDCPLSLPEGTDYNFGFSDTVVEDLGVFFQLDYQVTDTVQVNFGGRYSDNYIKRRSAPGYWPGLAALFGTPALDATTGEECPAVGASRGLYCPANMRDLSDPEADWERYKGDEPTWKVGVNWEPYDNHFFYAFYARGFKTGQPILVDRTTGEFDPTVTPIVEEIVDNYEFGWKGTLLDGALYAELNYFYSDYQNMQVAGLYATSMTTSGSQVGNAGGATIEGFEGTVRANIGNLNLTGTFGYTKSEMVGISTYDTDGFDGLLPDTNSGQIPIGDSSKGCVEGTDQLCYDFSPFALSVEGAENVNAPKLSYNLSVDYPIALDNGSLLTPKLSYRHTDAHSQSILQSAYDNYYMRDEVDTLDFSVTYTLDDWVLQAFVNNLTDETYVANAGGSLLYGDPRTAGVRAKMSF